MVEATVPVISVVIGEGGSEGALALGLSDRILMQQYAIYSPISLNRTLGGPFPDHMLDREAAEALMLTAHDCLELGIADGVVAEPEGGAHTNPREAANVLQVAILKQLTELSKLSQGKLLKRRYQKFRRICEGSNYSQDAMAREVEMLMNISSEGTRRRVSRSQKRKAPEDESAEVQVSSTQDT